MHSSIKYIFVAVVSSVIFLGCNSTAQIDQSPTAKSNAVLTQIAKDHTLGGSKITVPQLGLILPTLSSVNSKCEIEYQAYIADANNSFSPTIAKQSEVQKMINEVQKMTNNGATCKGTTTGSTGGAPTAGGAPTVSAQTKSDSVLTKIGQNNLHCNSNITLAELNLIIPAITGINANNLKAYNAYIANCKAHSFSNPPTQAEIQAMINAVNYVVSAALPGGVTIDRTLITSYIVSIFDNTPYAPPISIQGKIDMTVNPLGIMVKVPYTVTNSTTVTIPPFKSPLFTIDVNSTSNGESNITVWLEWSRKDLPVGSGTFNAYIKIDDSYGNSDNSYDAKKLDIENDLNGFTAASLLFPAGGDKFNIGTLQIKVIPGAPDRMFNVLTNGIYEHRFLYFPITSPVTGRTWLSNNLGAEYADKNNPNNNFNLLMQAKTSTDTLAYGSLFQWGRKADGHEIIKWTTVNTGTAKYGTSNIKSDKPSDSLFIMSSITPYDWRPTPVDTLWESSSSINNVCPIGYRLPTSLEWKEEIGKWSSSNSAGALNSILKLPMAGLRDFTNGTINNTSTSGYYWSATINGIQAMNIDFTTGAVHTSASSNRANGYSVRCIKDKNN